MLRSFVMEVHCVRLRIFLPGVADEVVDRAQVGTSFHAELAVEPASYLAVVLIWAHDTMPNYDILVQS